MVNLLPCVFVIFSLNKGLYLNYHVLSPQNKMVFLNANIVTYLTLFALFLIPPTFPSNFGENPFSPPPISTTLTLVLFGCSPLEVLFHQKADYSTLRPFGSTCFVLFSPHERSKLSFKAIMCLLRLWHRTIVVNFVSDPILVWPLK